VCFSNIKVLEFAVEYSFKAEILHQVEVFLSFFSPSVQSRDVMVEDRFLWDISHNGDLLFNIS